MINWRRLRASAALPETGRPRVLFVCMGNLCRSPMAEVIARALAQQVGAAPGLEFDSAGTHDLGGGGRLDPRGIAALARHGYGVALARPARRLTLHDFEQCEQILGMDHDNLAWLRRACPAEHAHKIGLFLEATPGLEGVVVPDPYFGSPEGFDRVVELCVAGVRGLLAARAEWRPEVVS